MPTAHVRGSHTLQVVPDEAVLSIGLRGSGGDQETAARELVEATRLVEAAVERHDLELVVPPPRMWSRQEPFGEREHYALVMASVRVPQPDVLSDLVSDVALLPGVDLSGLRWQISNRAEVLRQARVLAIADARAVADDYAHALGLSVVEVVSVSDSGSGGSHYDHPFAAAGAAPRGSAGDAEPVRFEVSAPVAQPVTGTVDLVYRLDVLPG